MTSTCNRLSLGLNETPVVVPTCAHTDTRVHEDVQMHTVSFAIVVHLSHIQYKAQGHHTAFPRPCAPPPSVTPPPQVLEAIQLKKAFFTADLLSDISRKLVTHYLLLREEELQAWHSDPEEFCEGEVVPSGGV